MAERGIVGPVTTTHRDRTRKSVVSYWLTRQRLVDAFSRGTKTEAEVCDAQPELRRVAHHCSQPLAEDCPICGSEDLVAVTFAFGPGLPRAGRALSDISDLRRLRRRRQPYTCYQVEVCRQCWWNHLRESYAVEPMDVNP